METDRKSADSGMEASGSLQESPDLAASTLLVHGKRYKKHEQHWYEEGNFGFLVDTTAFRLHRSILSRRSSVLSDMFSTPQPLFPIPQTSDSEDNIVGVPFVELYDQVDDFAHVLNFIYPTSLPAGQTGHFGVRDLMGIVKFTGKYLIDDLRQWAVAKLGAELLPATSPTSSLKALLETPSLYADPKFSVELVQFSRECSLPQFLPLACYALATAEWDQIPLGASCLDCLSPQDRTRIHEGRLALIKEVLEKVSGAPDKLSRREDCTQDGCKSLVWIKPSIRWKGLMLHPLEELEARLNFSYSSFCVDCAKNLLTQTRTFRDELLGRLTEFFKLES